MSNYNIIVKEIIEHLQGLNIEESIIDRCKWRSNNYTKGDIYEYADRIISNEIYTLIGADVNAKIYCKYMGYGNGNFKDRYIDIQYKNGKSYDDYISLIRINYTINCKKEKSNWEIANIVIKASAYSAEDKTTKSIQQLIDDSLESIRRWREENLNVHLPQHIIDSQNLFNKVIEAMKKGEDISWDDKYKLENVIDKYNRLNNREYSVDS